MIADTISQQIADALKAHDELRLSTLRMLSSALNYEKIAKQHELSSDEEIVVVQKEAKKRKDAIEAYEKASAQDRADREKEELKILEEYLPEQLDKSDLEAIVDETIAEQNASQISDMGKVIGAVMGKVKGKADGKDVSEIVKVKLTK
jgi:hypothetical protein